MYYNVATLHYVTFFLLLPYDLGSVTNILVPQTELGSQKCLPLPILVPPMKSKQAKSYSWMNALHLSWYLILRS